MKYISPHYSTLVIWLSTCSPCSNRTTFHDDIQGTTFWPKLYDGRAIRGSSYEDHAKGVSLEENLKLFNEAKEKGDNSREVTWS